jgi:hypothetical protein
VYTNIPRCTHTHAATLVVVDIRRNNQCIKDVLYIYLQQTKYQNTYVYVCVYTWIRVYIRDIFFFNTNSRFEIFFILVILDFMLLLLFIYIKHTILQFYPTSVLLLRPPIPGPALIELSLLLRLLLLSAFFNKYLLLKNFLKR